MDSSPLISVIMSVYNEEAFIYDAIKSILDQTENDFEFLIVDDCSTDKTVEIIESFKDERIRLIRNDENLGLTKNLNKALKLAKGKFIARMDGDDISLPDRFKIQTKFLNDHPDVMLISCNTSTFGEQILVSDIEGTPEELACTMLLRPVLAHPGFMFRRELYSAHGFTYDEHFRSAQDYDLASRVIKQFKIGVTPEVLLLYRNHRGQVSQNPSMKQTGFADEVRKRMLEDIGVRLSESEYNSYRKWAMESDADIKDYKVCKRILRRILSASKELKDGAVLEKNISEVISYDPVILKKRLEKQYYKWILRTSGKKHLPALLGINPVEYVNILKVASAMTRSKKTRQAIAHQIQEAIRL
ncbi:MAG: glycosyltransferase [Lachnospiraceae bacterium]|nr:glycosyltransferase [Lachnospiraceae bacterium]